MVFSLIFRSFAHARLRNSSGGKNINNTHKHILLLHYFSLNFPFNLYNFTLVGFWGNGIETKRNGMEMDKKHKENGMEVEWESNGIKWEWNGMKCFVYVWEQSISSCGCLLSLSRGWQFFHLRSWERENKKIEKSPRQRVWIN